MRRTFVIHSLEEMCDLMCDNRVPGRTNGEEIMSRLPDGAEIYARQETMDAVVIKIPKKWWESEV